MIIKSDTKGDGVIWTWEDVKYLCPSLDRAQCEKALYEARLIMLVKMTANVWESLENALVECGYTLEGEKCE